MADKDHSATPLGKKLGAKPGVVFEPSPWEGVFAALSYAEQGNLELGRELIAEAIAGSPGAWQGRSR